jgi:Ca-activated chloride channel family protein
MLKNLQVNFRSDAGLVSSETPTTRVLEVSFNSPTAKAGKDGLPLNLALVIDRSGSMSGGKLEQAKDAAMQILNLMRPQDSVSIVDFDDKIRVSVDCPSVTSEARREAQYSIRQLQPGGSTNLGDGWLTGCEYVARRLNPGKVSRTLLLTDGQANVGTTDPLALGQQASDLFERGVPTSTFGIGEGFNEHLLETMSNRGGGNFYYIDHTGNIASMLMHEFADLAAITLRNVVIELTFPAGVTSELFGDWRSESAARKLTVSLPDLAAGQSVNLYLRTVTPPGNGELVLNMVIRGMDEDGDEFNFTYNLALRYVPQIEADAAVRDADLDARFATVAAGQMRNQALILERQGRREEAFQVMDKMMNEFGPSLPAFMRQRHASTHQDIRSGFDETRRKSEHYDSFLERKYRHPDQVRTRPEDKQDDKK